MKVIKTETFNVSFTSKQIHLILIILFSHFLHIYIVIYRQTVSFYQNSSVWLDT